MLLTLSPRLEQHTRFEMDSVGRIFEDLRVQMYSKDMQRANLSIQ